MKVGVIGAGTMGSGIAQAFAQTEGYEVCLCDINDEFAANGKNKIAKGFEKIFSYFSGREYRLIDHQVKARPTEWAGRIRQLTNTAG